MNADPIERWTVRALTATRIDGVFAEPERPSVFTG